jgi:hypothetical protein
MAAIKGDNKKKAPRKIKSKQHKKLPKFIGAFFISFPQTTLLNYWI